MKRKLLFYAASVSTVALLLGLLVLIATSSMYREGAQLQDDLMQHVTVAAPPTQTAADPTPEPMPDPAPETPHEASPAGGREVFILPDHIVLPEVDFGALYEINADVVAWLILPDTPIHHPVVQGTDNYHYLRHIFDGRRSNIGTLFVDTYNEPGFVDRNTIIYGHNLQDGSMFAVLENYSSQDFFNAHPWVFLLTPTGNYVIQLFAGYVTDVEGPSWRLWFSDDDDEFKEWVNAARARSDFVSDVEVRPSDQVVTLSTCSLAFYDARYVVVGRLLPIA